MSFDLQQIPCYNSNKCKDIYNCAPTTSIHSCSDSSPTSPPNVPACPANQEHLYCFGSDPNYCSGIIQQCDPNSGYYCNSTVSNPAVNYFSENLGCDVKKDPSCMEFENSVQCQDNCWDLGGSKEIKNVCNSLFKDEKSCNEMKYFCKWKGGACGESIQDPWKNFIEEGPKNNDGTPKAIFSENVGDKTIDCAQSSWSSTQVTSYADTIRTCCINGGTGKKCITTPRCQFVENTCDCGFKDISYSKNPSYNPVSSISDQNSVRQPWFICENTQQSVIVNNDTYLKKGYCTWCKGSQLKNFDYRDWLINKNALSPGSNIRKSDAWGAPGNCNNRCSNYNLCENNKSEVLWNECVWRHSNGSVGVDPTSHPLNLSKGFCYLDNCLENATNQEQIDKCNNMNNLKDVCENELSSIVSTKNQLSPITVNTGIPTERCSEGTTWNHSCTMSNDTTQAENFTCGWCPDLQNDWPENPCPTKSNILTNWYSPLSVIGINNQDNAIIAVTFIILFGLLIIALFSFLVWFIKKR